MDNITQYKPNEYVQALQSPIIVKMDKKVALISIAEILIQTYFDCGQKITETANYSRGLYQEIETYFKWLQIDELKICLKNGSRNVYGDYFGLNIVTYHKWIKAFEIEEKRVNAKKVILEQNKKVQVKPELSEFEKLKIRDEFIEFCINSYKKTGTLNACMNIDLLYKNLIETGKMCDTMNDYLDEATEKYHDHLHFKTRTLNQQERKRNLQIYEAFGQLENKHNSTPVITLSKELAIIDWINSN